MNSRLEKNVEEKSYRKYIADTLYYKGRGKVLVNTYNEIINPKPKDNRSGDEIAEDIIRRHGLKLR